jgi:hypothetical protein
MSVQSLRNTARAFDDVSAVAIVVISLAVAFAGALLVGA